MDGQGTAEAGEKSIDPINSTTIVKSPLSQNTYLAIWAIAIVASFAIFFAYF
jgi:hypothetical protein